MGDTFVSKYHKGFLGKWAWEYQICVFGISFGQPGIVDFQAYKIFVLHIYFASHSHGERWVSYIPMGMEVTF